MGSRVTCPIPWKFLQTCWRTWLVPLDPDLWISLGERIQECEGWSFSISRCYPRGQSVLPSPWGRSPPFWIHIPLYPRPSFEGQKGAWDIQVSSRFKIYIYCGVYLCCLPGPGCLCLLPWAWWVPQHHWLLYRTPFLGVCTMCISQIRDWWS